MSLAALLAFKKSLQSRLRIANSFCWTQFCKSVLLPAENKAPDA